MTEHQTPIIKYHEALGAIADERVSLVPGGAEVTSSSGNKRYLVRYDEPSKRISSNDNGSYWRGYLGYPSIAFLLASRRVAFDSDVAKSLRGIPWKDLNSRLGNDYAQTIRAVEDHLRRNHVPSGQLNAEVKRIEEAISKMELETVRSDTPPPDAY